MATLNANAPFKKISFNAEAYTKRLDTDMGEIVRQAAREWLRAVLQAIVGAPYTQGDNFPIWSGQAKGSLKPLGRYLRVSVPVSPRPAYTVMEWDKRTNKHRERTYRPPNLVGRGQARGRFKIRDNKSHPGTYKYSFNFTSSVFHFLWNEVNSSEIPTSQTPWDSILAGNLAFKTFIQQTVKRRLPRVKNYITLVRPTRTTRGI